MCFAVFVPMLTTLYSCPVLALPHRRPIVVLSTVSPRKTPTRSFEANIPSRYPPTTTIQYNEPGTKGVSYLRRLDQQAFSENCSLWFCG